MAAERLEFRAQLEEVLGRALQPALARLRGEIHGDLRGELALLTTLGADKVVSLGSGSGDGSPRNGGLWAQPSPKLGGGGLRSPLPLSIVPSVPDSPCAPETAGGTRHRDSSQDLVEEIQLGRQLPGMSPEEESTASATPKAKKASVRASRPHWIRGKLRKASTLFITESQAASNMSLQDDTATRGHDTQIVGSPSMAKSRGRLGLFVHSNSNAWGGIPVLFRSSVPSVETTASMEREVPGWRHRTRAMVETALFDSISGLLILANAVSIGIQTSYMAEHSLLVAPAEYRTIELVFFIFFSLELAMRALAYGYRLFDVRNTSGRWATFDAVIITLQLLELLLDSLITLENTSFLRLLRMLRLVRVLRVVRIIRLLGELRTIVSSIMNSMRALFWTLVLLLLGIYLLGIYFTQLVLDWRIVSKERLKAVEEEPLLRYFGQLSRSILSLYQAMSGGIDWDAMCAPLIEEISPLHGFVFVLYIAFTVLALMNVVTGVFVEGSLRRAKQEEQRDIIDQLKKFFREFDEDNSGWLSASEFQTLLADSRMKNYLREIDVDLEEVDDLFTMLDEDQRGQIDYLKFIAGCMRLRSSARAYDVMMCAYDIRQINKKQAEHYDAMRAGFLRLEESLDGQCSVLARDSLDRADRSGGAEAA